MRPGGSFLTGFYREPGHFGFVSAAVREWLAQGQRRFRFWSAACSSGEEPLSLAMTLLEACNGLDVDTRVLATDISTQVLDKCNEAVYRADRMRPVPARQRERWFVRERGADGETQYRARPQLTEMVLYRRLNLSVPPFPMRGPMDAIFCRNVMIYFDDTVRRALLSEIHRLLRPGGFLFVGHAESLTGMMSPLKSVRPSIYVKP
jgi:chemotaxis protein methyltransferase CheR